MRSTYHKREIKRVMSWTQNDNYKFEQLEHFFYKYFTARLLEQSRRKYKRGEK